MVSPRQALRGVSLIETAVSTTVLATLIGVAAPSLVEQTTRQRLQAVAAQFETDLQLARAEAVLRSQSVRLTFLQDAFGSCYVVHSGAAADCRCDSSGQALCTAGTSALRVAAIRQDLAIELRSSSPSMLIDAVGGTVTPTATVQLRSPAGSLHQVVNIMGRVRTCTPDGSMPGHRRC